MDRIIGKCEKWGIFGMDPKDLKDPTLLTIPKFTRRINDLCPFFNYNAGD
jgi:hypothetical protein